MSGKVGRFCTSMVMLVITSCTDVTTANIFRDCHECHDFEFLTVLNAIVLSAFRLVKEKPNNRKATFILRKTCFLSFLSFFSPSFPEDKKFTFNHDWKQHSKNQVLRFNNIRGPQNKCYIGSLIPNQFYICGTQWTKKNRIEAAFIDIFFLDFAPFLPQINLNFGSIC